MTSWRHGPGVSLVLLLTAGCARNQSALVDDGAGAAAISSLFGIFLSVCLVVWLLVVAVLAVGLWRRRADPATDPLAPRPGDGTASRVIGAAVAATAIIVMALTTFSYFTGRGLANVAGDNPMTIRVIGNQWWWDVTYQDPDPSRQLRTANEIRIPVGRPVKVLLDSNDVIHSFWVPSLNGKEDAIPGRTIPQ